MAKAVAKGDPSFLRMRNKELSANVTELRKENSRLKDMVRRSSPEVPSPTRKRRVERMVIASDIDAIIYDIERSEEILPLPTSLEMYPSQRNGKNKDKQRNEDNTDQERERVFNIQIEDLIAERRLIREKRKKGKNTERSNDSFLINNNIKPKIKEGRSRPRITENIQLVPPSTVRSPALDRLLSKEDLQSSNAEEEWQIVRGGRKQRKVGNV